MHKATARADQFFDRSGNESTKGSRRGYSLLGGGDSPLTVLSDDQRRENERNALIAEKEALMIELRELRRKLNFQAKNKADWYKSLARKDEVCNRLTALAPLIKALKPMRPKIDPSDLAQCFVTACKESMTPAAFNAFMEAAKRIAKERKSCKT